MKRVLSDAAFTAASQAATVISVILVQIALVRIVTPAVFGQLALAQALVAVMEGALVSRGAEATIQIFGQNWDRGPNVLRAIARRLERHDVLISLGGYVAFALAVVVIAPLLKVNGWYAAFLGFAAVLQINYGLRRSLFLLHNQIRRQAVFEIIQAAVGLVIILTLVWLFGEWGFIAGTLASAALKNFSVHVQTRDLWRPIGAAAGSTIVAVDRTITISSLHSVLRNLLTNAANNADIILLGLFGRPEFVAIYRVAKTLASMPIRVAGPMWVVLRPRLLSALVADDHQRYCITVAKAAALFAVVSVAGIVTTFLIGPVVLRHFYGSVYANSIDPLLILMVGSSIFGAVTGWLSFTMVITSRKSLGTAIFAAQLALIAGGGVLFGGASASAMAWVVTGANAIISILAWWALLAGRFRHANRSQDLAV